MEQPFLKKKKEKRKKKKELKQACNYYFSN